MPIIPQTPSTWIDDTNTSFDSIDNNYYNKKVIIDKDGVEKLVKFIEDPPYVIAFFTTPSNWISSLIYFPINIPYSTKNKKLKIGKFLERPLDTNIECAEFFTPNQYFIPVGSQAIHPKFYNFADFNGYTRIQVWLPYYGYVELLPNDVMGKTVSFWLSVDYNTGSAMYYICVKDSADTLTGYDRIIMTVTFQLGFSIPLGSSNAADMIRNITLGVLKGAGTIAITSAAIKGGGTGGVSTTTSTTSKSAKSTHRNPSTGRQATQSTYSIDTSETSTSQYDNTKFLKNQLAQEVFNTSMSALEQMHLSAQTDKPNNVNLTRNGSRSIKIVIQRPIIKDITSEYTHLMGKPLGRVLTLGDLTGYTEISYVHTEGEDFATATAEEMSLLNNELLGGILL